MSKHEKFPPLTPQHELDPPALPVSTLLILGASACLTAFATLVIISRALPWIVGLSQ